MLLYNLFCCCLNNIFSIRFIKIILVEAYIMIIVNNEMHFLFNITVADSFETLPDFTSTSFELNESFWIKTTWYTDLINHDKKVLKWCHYKRKRHNWKFGLFVQPLTKVNIYLYFLTTPNESWQPTRTNLDGSKWTFTLKGTGREGDYFLLKFQTVYRKNEGFQ